MNGPDNQKNTNDHPHNEHGHPVLSWDDDGEHDVDETGHYQLMAEAIRQLAIEKGIITADQVRKQLELLDTITPAAGVKIVTRAWTDPLYKKRLLEDGRLAVAELGLDAIEAPTLIVVENTPEVHNVVVCTLCSCYPRSILGLPPDWYKSKSYRSRAVIEPRTVLREFGTELPENVTVRTHDSNADMRYLVLPMRPEGTNDWSEEQLAELVTRDSMVGVTLATAPEKVAAA